ncbi:MAG: glycosyltransferase family 2 protein [Chloroflexi bacterium]|nr:glycosyltransferase family 2 protein [Chloroflexota bacterium]
MFVSIIIPTYNEADDIRQTLDSLVALDYEDKEIIVVDASQDNTPQIVRSYSTKQVTLIIQSRGKGRAAARNEGILAARGEIVIILNADVRLPSDFIQRILKHYEAGADYVLVESRITNIEKLPARYAQVLHEYYFPPRPEIEAHMNWTEGFSCRHSAALAAGLFPEGEAFPLVAGEDGWFGEKLAAAGHKKIFDRSIVVTHIAPASAKDFWDKRIERGRGVPPIWKLRDQWTLTHIIRVVITAAFLSSLALVIPMPSIQRAWQQSLFSPRGRKDFLNFIFLDWLTTAGNVWGLIRGVIDLYHVSIR